MTPTDAHRIPLDPFPDGTLLLLRHADRGPIPHGEPGNDVPLLPIGVERARALGRMLGVRLGVLRSSPVPRCMETARAIAEGAHQSRVIPADRLLGDPGVYVEDGERAWGQWLAMGHEGVMHALVAGIRLPGLADPPQASSQLLKHLLETAGEAPGVHVFVTHDLLVTAAAAHWLRLPLGPPDWPDFLEGIALLPSPPGVRVRYRGWSGLLPITPASGRGRRRGDT